MAVVAVQRIWAGRTGSADEKAVREYTGVYQVIVNAFTDDFATVTAAAGIPRLFDVWVGSDGQPDSLRATCRKIEAHEPDGDQPFRWEVVCRYSNKTEDPSYGDPDPLLRPSEIEWDFEARTRVLTVTTDGKAVTSSATEKFDPPVEAADDVLVLRITRNEDSYDPAIARLYKNAISTDVFYGAPAGYAQLKPIRGSRHYENGRTYYQKTYTIHFRGENDPPWQPTVLDAGYVTKDRSNAASKVKAIFDETSGAPLQGPVPLDGAGGQLSKATAVLSGALDNIATDFVPVSSPFWLANATFPITILIDNEQMTVTAAAAQNGHYTIKRGVNSTAKAAHAANATIYLQPVFLSFKAYPELPFAALRLP